MRETKFRVFDKEKGQMLYDGFCIIPTLPYWSATKYFTPRIFEAPEWFDCTVFDWADGNTLSGNYELIEYTGLKDNTKWEALTKIEQKEWIDRGETKETWNGKEIYEGDIIQELNLYGNDEKVSEVVFSEGGFWLRYPNSDYTCPLHWIAQEYRKVIGNVNENPGLLEAKDEGD